MIEKPKQHEWIERAREARDLDTMQSVALEILKSNAATDEQISAAKSTLNAIDAALKKNATSITLTYARNRFASLKMTL